MAISELSAVLKLEMGSFKSSLSVAQKSMDGFAEDTKKAMSTASESTQKSQGIFSKAFNGMADAGDRLKAKQSSLTSTLAKTALGFVGIKSAADIFNAAIGRTDKIESAKKAITRLTGSNEKAKIVMDGLQKVVDGTPLSLDNFTASAKGMVAAGMEAEKVEGVMTAVGDAAYGVGNGAESIDIMASAFKSLQASGTASLGDLNRLMDQNIPVYKILGNQMGKSTEEMKKFISDGLLPSGEAMDMLVKGIEEGTDGINGSTAGMAGQMTTAGETIAGAAGNIKTAIVKVLAVPLTEAYEKIVDGLNATKEGIKKFQPFLISAFTAITEIVEGVILGVIDTVKMLKPAFDVVVEVVKALAEKFGGLGKDGKTLTDVVREMTPVVLGLIAAFKAFTILAKIASSIRLVYNAVNGSVTAFNALGTAGKLLTLTIKGVSAAFSFLAAHPIVLIIAAIAAVVGVIVYLWKTNEGFRDAIKNIWESIKSAVGTAVDAVVGFFKGLWDSIVEIWDSIVAFFAPIIETIVNVITVGFMLIKEIISGILLVIKTLIELIWNGIKAYFEFWFSIYSAIFEAGWNLIKGIVETVFNAIKVIVETVWNGISAFLTVIWNTLVAIATPIFEVLKAVIETVWNVIKAITETVWNIIKTVLTTIWNGIVSVVTVAINVINTVITTAWNVIKAVTLAVWNGIKAVITTVWEGIKTVISTAVNTVKSVITSVWNGIKSVTTSVWNGIKNAMTAPVEAAKNKIKGIIDAIKGFFSNIRLKLPKIGMPPLPHFSITGKFSLKPPSVPRLSVSWYAKGGIATDASIVGIGEAGDEAIVPLSNKGRMKPFAQAVSSMIDDDKTYNNSGTQFPEKITVEIPLVIGGRTLATVMIDDLMKLIEKREARKFRKAGDN